MDKASGVTRKAISILERGRAIWRMGLASISGNTAISMRENGLRTLDMAKAKIISLMVTGLREHMSEVSHKEKVFTIGITAVCMRVSLWMERRTVMASGSKQMAIVFRASIFKR
jgi:hypothetical protein